MRGKHRIVVQNKRIRYDFEIKRNITVIRGERATGKTALVNMIREYFENGNASGVELKYSKRRLNPAYLKEKISDKIIAVLPEIKL